MSTDVSVLKGVFSYKNLVHAIAGATGSVVAITVFYPLDTARTRLQVDDSQKADYSFRVIKDILEKEGVVGLYRGWFPVVTSVCCSNFVYFYVFSGLKLYAYSNGAKPYPAKDLFLAFLAGVTNVVITTPLWVANTRLKLQGVKVQYNKGSTAQLGQLSANRGYGKENGPSADYKGMIDALQRIAREEGVKSLWSSTVPSLVLASNPAVHFMVYEALKRNIQRSLRAEELSGFVYFVMGALAKMVATFVTYPLQVVQSRLRSVPGRSETMMKCFRSILRANGWHGMYKGLETKLTQTVATAALMFLMYEKIATLVFRIMRQQQHLRSKAA